MTDASRPDADAIYETMRGFTRDELRRVVALCLHESFDAVASDKPVDDQAFEIVQWAVRKGRLQALADCVRSKQAPEDGEPPYKGLAYFDVADAPLFFGPPNLGPNSRSTTSWPWSARPAAASRRLCAPASSRSLPKAN